MINASKLERSKMSSIFHLHFIIIIIIAVIVLFAADVAVTQLSWVHHIIYITSKKCEISTKDWFYFSRNIRVLN